MASRSAITTHVLDTARGCPAAGVPIVLEALSPDGAAGGVSNWTELGRGITDADGRLNGLCDPSPIAVGQYRVTFDTATYFAKTGTESFYPEAQVTFAVGDGSQHFHVPLLLSPFGYSTYRGS